MCLATPAVRVQERPAGCSPQRLAACHHAEFPIRRIGQRGDCYVVKAGIVSKEEARRHAEDLKRFA